MKWLQSLQIKRSLLLMISLSFILLYAIANFIHFRKVNMAYYESYRNEKILAIDQHTKIIKGLIGDSSNINMDLIKEILTESKKLGQIDGAAASIAKQVIFSSHPDDALILSKLGFDNNGLYKDRDLVAAQIENGSVKISLISYISQDQYYNYVFAKNQGDIFKDIFIVSLMLILVVFYFSKDIMQLIYLLQNKGDKKFQFQSANTEEAEILKHGLVAYREKFNHLQKKYSLLDANTLPALKEELFSGQTPPYIFSAVVIRVDINRFSYYFNRVPIEEYMALIKQYFIKVSYIVGRYSGHIKEYLGDEIIFYLKVGDSEATTVGLAFACVRDIFIETHKFAPLFKKQLDVDFSVKAAASMGALRFGPFVSGFDISGLPLIESVRILAEADSNTQEFLFTEQLNQYLAGPFKTKFKKQTTMKGFVGEVRIWVLSLYSDLACAPVDKFVDLLDVKEKVTYYRSNEDLIWILDTILINFKGDKNPKTQLENIHSVLLEIKKIDYSYNSVEDLLLLEARIAKCVAIFEELQSRTQSTSKDDAHLVFFILATFTSMIVKLVPKDDVNNLLFAQLAKNFKLANTRIIANTIDAFIYLQPAYLLKYEAELRTHQNNRIQGNLLLYFGMNKFSKKVQNRVYRMIMSSDPFTIASGLYAVRELIAYYKGEDLTHLLTNLDIGKLKKRLGQLDGETNEMVNRQLELLSIELNSLQPKAG